VSVASSVVAPPWPPLRKGGESSESAWAITGEKLAANRQANVSVLRTIVIAIFFASGFPAVASARHVIFV
jgi:hypothetical protein